MAGPSMLPLMKDAPDEAEVAAAATPCPGALQAEIRAANPERQSPKRKPVTALLRSRHGSQGLPDANARCRSGRLRNRARRVERGGTPALGGKQAQDVGQLRARPVRRDQGLEPVAAAADAGLAGDLEQAGLGVEIAQPERHGPLAPLAQAAGPGRRRELLDGACQVLGEIPRQLDLEGLLAAGVAEVERHLGPVRADGDAAGRYLLDAHDFLRIGCASSLHRRRCAAESRRIGRGYGERDENDLPQEEARRLPPPDLPTHDKKELS